MPSLGLPPSQHFDVSTDPAALEPCHPGGSVEISLSGQGFHDVGTTD